MAAKLTEQLLILLSGLSIIPFGRELTVFIISLLPILELRGGLIAASLLGLTPVKSYLICTIANIIPIFFILLLFDKIYLFMKQSHIKILKNFALFLDKKVEKHRASIEQYDFWGLTLFVGIPLPGTGAWTGCMVATILKMDKKKAFLASSLGVIIASIIMMILSFGLLGQLL